MDAGSKHGRVAQFLRHVLPAQEGRILLQSLVLRTEDIQVKKFIQYIHIHSVIFQISLKKLLPKERKN